MGHAIATRVIDFSMLLSLFAGKAAVAFILV